eukprot:GHVN01052585.1.p1 GENE.GHVN01052585.1~~GHVN01052585.1.p1  ORF type:complete len:383 (-),score=51.35 GHVN01052585.1:528-1625(-)
MHQYEQEQRRMRSSARGNRETESGRHTESPQSPQSHRDTDESAQRADKTPKAGISYEADMKGMPGMPGMVGMPGMPGFAAVPGMPGWFPPPPANAAETIPDVFGVSVTPPQHAHQMSEFYRRQAQMWLQICHNQTRATLHESHHHLSHLTGIDATAGQTCHMCHLPKKQEETSSSRACAPHQSEELGKGSSQEMQDKEGLYYGTSRTVGVQTETIEIISSWPFAPLPPHPQMLSAFMANPYGAGGVGYPSANVGSRAQPVPVFPPMDYHYTPSPFSAAHYPPPSQPFYTQPQYPAHTAESVAPQETQSPNQRQPSSLPESRDAPSATPTSSCGGQVADNEGIKEWRLRQRIKYERESLKLQKEGT